MEGRPGKFPENSTDLKNANDPETVRGDIHFRHRGKTRTERWRFHKLANLLTDGLTGVGARDACVSGKM